MITITEKAAAKVLETAQRTLEEDPTFEWEGLRISVRGGGCAGFTQDLVFEEAKNVTDLDERFENRGIRFIIDPISAQYLEDTEIDYVERSEFEQGFKFNNPNVSGSCGCGSSVKF